MKSSLPHICPPWADVGMGLRERKENRVKHHYCPACDQPYACPRGEPGCGSPEVYDCLCCYQRRYRQELKALAGAVAARFATEPGAAIRVESENIYPELAR